MLALEEPVGLFLGETNSLHVPYVIGSMKNQEVQLGSFKCYWAIFGKPNGSLKWARPGSNSHYSWPNPHSLVAMPRLGWATYWARDSHGSLAHLTSLLPSLLEK